MKKFYSMFAFAVAIVLGAFALASCDDDIEDPANTRHRFTVEVKMYTSMSEHKEEVAMLEKKLAASIIDYFEDDLRSSMTEGTASIIWMNAMNRHRQDFQSIANAAWNDYKDKEFTLTLIMKEDGNKNFKEEVFKPNNHYLDF